MLFLCAPQEASPSQASGARRQHNGGLLHLFPMAPGCPVPKDLQELKYECIVVELYDKV